MILDSCKKAADLAAMYGFYNDSKCREIWAVFVSCDLRFLTSKQIESYPFTHAIEVSSSKIYDTAFKCEAYGVILYTNHLNDDVNPTKTDIGITKALKDALKNHKLHLIDHIIVHANKYYSFSECREYEII